LNQLESEDVVDLASYQSLEDAKQSLDLAVRSYDWSAAYEEGLPYPSESWDVATLLPQRGGKKRAKQGLVLWGKLCRWMEFK